ncbi:MAG: hypothetical protein ACPGN3_13755 [Opitutales bacterium]
MKSMLPLIFAASLSVNAAEFPYVTDFETNEGFTPGLLSSDPDWLFDAATLSVSVIDTDSISGQQSLSLTGTTPFTLNPTDSFADQVRWVDFYVKPVFADDTPATIDTLQSAVTAFVKSGATGTVYMLDGDDEPNGAWVSATPPIPLTGDVSANWIRLTYRLDYASKTWGLFIDKQLEATSLGFWDDTFSTLSDFKLQADDTTPTGLDYFYAGDTNPLYSEHRPYFYAGRATGVSSDLWTEIALPRPYKNPVVITTPIYDQSSDDPAVVRLQGVKPGAAHFELRVQNPPHYSTGEATLSGYEVEYLVVEAGVYTQEIHGIDMEVGTLQSATINAKGAWSGTAELFLNAEISNPRVLGQVMTSNDPAWSTFWSNGGSQTSVPGNQIFVGMHSGGEEGRTHIPETLGYVIFEATSGVVEGREFLSDITSDTITHTPQSLSLPVETISTLANLVATQAAMDGGDGSWMVIDKPDELGTNAFTLVTDEDQFADSERSHTSEQAVYLAWGVDLSTDSNTDGLPDWWQQWYVDVNPFDTITSIGQVTTLTDADGDGVADYTEDTVEGTDFTNPYDNSLSGRIVYIDASAGDDLNTGRAPIQLDTYTGPKQTLSAGLETVEDSETLEIATGSYTGTTTLLPAGKNLTIRPSGPVTIQ